jgi:hypothetical protein
MAAPVDQSGHPAVQKSITQLACADKIDIPLEHRHQLCGYEESDPSNLYGKIQP